MAYCLVPALQLLYTCREHPASNDEMGEVVRLLEELLTEHIVLPLRHSFLGLDAAADLSKDVSFTSFSERMVSVLRQDLPHLGSPLLRADWKTEKHLALSMVSLLFDIAIRCRPRSTPRMRRLESPWLERLFVELAKCAEAIFPPVSPTRAQKDYIRVIRWMLRKAVDYQVQLSLSTVNALLDQTSGLFQRSNESDMDHRSDLENDSRVEWDLISLCLLSDSDVFVIPSSSSSDNEIYAYRPPNKYLSALFQNITNEMCFESLEEDKDYDFKLLHVIKPLCNAFINARDFTGFLEHWREQLTIAQERQKTQGTHFDPVPSIWEDERLLLYVAQSLESSLTAGQIDQVISTAARDLAPSIPNVLGDKSMSIPSLVILDCMTSGLTMEETLSKLESKALSVFSLLGILVSEPSRSSSPQGWRLWRIMATITDRWLSLRESSGFKCKAHPAICMASVKIDRISPELKLDDDIDLTQELYAFNFMLKFAAMEDSFWEDPHFSSRRKILWAVTRIIDIMEPFCHRISYDHFGTMMRLEDASKGEQSSLRVSPVDNFYFNCIDMIIESPDILRWEAHSYLRFPS